MTQEEDERIKRIRMERDREYDEDKRRRFLEEQRKEKEGVANVKPKGIREKVAAFREERRYKAFKKQKDKEERQSKVSTKQEVEVFGKKLDAKEREEFESFKESRRTKQRERRRKIRQGFERAGQYSRKVAERAEELTDNVDNTSFGRGLDIGDKGNKFGGRDPLVEMFALKPIGGKVIQRDRSNRRKGDDQGRIAQTGPTSDPLMDMYRMPSGPAPGERDPLVEMFRLPSGSPDGGLGGFGAQPQGKKKKKGAPARDPLAEFFSLKWK